MTDDLELLRLYARDRSEAAFSELVGRRLNLVYSAALRQVGGDRSLAEDVTQMVFTELARRPATLSRHPTLSGWLFRTTRFKAIDAARAKQRRQVREAEAQTMNELLSSPEAPADWLSLRALLDEAVDKLGGQDRDAVLFRFFEGCSFAEIGVRLDLSENAARMRVDRALDKLRGLLAKRGFASTTAALAVTLADQAVTAAPAALAARIAGSALAGTAAGSGAFAFVQLMSATKLKIGIVSALLLGGAATIAVQHQSNLGLRVDNARLSDQNRELDRLRQENSRLKQEAGTIAGARGGGSQAQAIARRRAATGGASAGKFPLAPGLIPIQSLKNAGRATPSAAFQTQLWAAHNGDIDLTASAITFGPEARARMEALVAALPESAQETYNSPEKLMAFVLAGSPHPVGGMQVLGEQDVDANTAILQTQWQHEDDSVVHNTNAMMQNSGDGWKVVIPLVLVDGASSYLLRNPPE